MLAFREKNKVQAFYFYITEITKIGTGYIGPVSECFSHFEHEAACVAREIARRERGKVPMYEPALHRLLEKSEATGRLRSQALWEALQHAATTSSAPWAHRHKGQLMQDAAE